MTGQAMHKRARLHIHVQYEERLIKGKAESGIEDESARG